MKIIASVAVSIDGHIDDSSQKKLVLSSHDDFNEVRRLRSMCDAVLIGAETIRKDNPSLVTRSRELRSRRIKLGQCPDPIKITITSGGDIPLKSKFFKKGACQKIVYSGNKIKHSHEKELIKVATLVKFNNKKITAFQVVSDLKKRGVRSLWIEGGSSILTMFFKENLVNELRLAVAPFFVGDKNAPRIVYPNKFPFNKNKRMKLLSVTNLGDTAIARYRLKANS